MLVVSHTGHADVEGDHDENVLDEGTEQVGQFAPLLDVELKAVDFFVL